MPAASMMMNWSYTCIREKNKISKLIIHTMTLVYSLSFAITYHDLRERSIMNEEKILSAI